MTLLYLSNARRSDAVNGTVNARPSADDLIACLNWALHHASDITTEALDRWRADRASALGL